MNLGVDIDHVKVCVFWFLVLVLVFVEGVVVGVVFFVKGGL